MSRQFSNFHYPPAPGLHSGHMLTLSVQHRQSCTLMRFGEDQFLLIDYPRITATLGTRKEIADALSWLPIIDSMETRTAQPAGARISRTSHKANAQTLARLDPSVAAILDNLGL